MSFSLINKYSWIVFIITPLSFLLSWWIVRKYAGAAKGSGIPQVMAALELASPPTRHLIQKLLSFKIIIVKIVSSIAKVFGGGVLGREGPTIQISSSIFVLIYKFLPSWWPHISKKNILVAGAASGLAAAFNTPLGGIIFAIEELSKNNINYYKSPLFISVIIAGLTAQGLSGSYLYLGYPQLATSGYTVYLGVLLVAVLSGYFAAKTSVYMLKAINFVTKDKNISRQFLIVVLSGLIVASTIYFLGTDSMGSGKELMERMLFTNEKSVEWYIPIVRIGNLITSFSFGGAGGIFAPSLSSGATIGSLISDFLHLGGNNANLLIVIGMTSFLTGVTRALLHLQS
ncbi:MAG: chloride channel protein [Saprospiraceae bacterium]